MKIDKNAVKSSFSRAAQHYDEYALFQRDTGNELLQLVKNSSERCQDILDLGCGTGYFSKLLNQWQHQPSEAQTNSTLTCLDISPEMLQQTRLRGLKQSATVEGDIDAIPFQNDQFDLIYSNLVLQWSDDLSHALAQSKKCLKAQGVIAFSTLLDGSLKELKQAWQEVDDLPHINQFSTIDAVNSALAEAGFTQFDLICKTHSYAFPDLISVMKSLKGIGANHIHERDKAPVINRNTLQQLTTAYQPYTDQSGQLMLSYQVCYVIAVNSIN